MATHSSILAWRISWTEEAGLGNNKWSLNVNCHSFIPKWDMSSGKQEEPCLLVTAESQCLG